jgi:glycosyltransferase involved in cell wall biosynthesis
MRIAIDARYLCGTYSGIAKYSEHLLAQLSAQDTENEYVVYIRPGYQRRLRVGDNFKTVYVKAPPLSIRTLVRFGKRVKADGCDFLHSLAPIAPVVSSPQTILTLHDLQPMEPLAEIADDKSRLVQYASGVFYRFTLPRCVHDATWIICVSHATRDALVQLFPELQSKAIVVYSGVDESFRQRPETTIIQMVNKKLDLPQRYVFYVGSDRPNKNLSGMLRAFARMNEERGDEIGRLHFLLALGHDAESSRVMDMAKQLGIQEHIRVLGPLTEAEKHVLYHKALALFSVTRSEGFGLTVVEAQATGLPVLAGNDGATPEVTGDSALLVDPDDEEQISRGLARLILDEALAGELAEAGQQNVKRFNWEKTAERVYDIYRLLL